MMFCRKTRLQVAPPPAALPCCLGIVAMVLLVGGCTSRPMPVPPLSDNVVIAIDRDEDVPPGEILLKPVPGALSGRAVDVELYRSRKGANELVIPVGMVSVALARSAMLARSDTMNPGELANPRNMQIARVATFFRSANLSGECNNFRTGLRADWRSRAVLVYVDRPGSVRGVRYAEPWIMEYDLDFPEAGLYVIGMQAQGSHVTQRVVAAADALVARVSRADCKSGDVRQAAR